MGSPSEIGYMRLLKYFSSCSKRFRGMFNLNSVNFVSFYLSRLGVGLVEFCVFKCKLKPKLNYENKDDRKFKVVLRRLFCRFQNSFFRI